MATRKKKQDEQAEQINGTPRAISTEQLAYMAVMKLVCDGHQSSVFKLPMDDLIALGVFLLTPRSPSIDYWTWLNKHKKTTLKRSSVYRYAVSFKRAAYTVMIDIQATQQRNQS